MHDCSYHHQSDGGPSRVISKMAGQVRGRELVPQVVVPTLEVVVCAPWLNLSRATPPRASTCRMYLSIGDARGTDAIVWTDVAVLKYDGGGRDDRSWAPRVMNARCV